MERKTYILIEAEMGERASIKETLQNSKWVHSVERLTGPYDIIAVIDGSITHHLDPLIDKSIRGIRGVIDFIVCPAV